MTDQATRDAAADLIDKGMDLLRERGWCKGHLEDVQGRMCLDGALRAADGQDLWRYTEVSEAYYLAGQVVSREVRNAGTGRLVEISHRVAFNDHPDTTLEDVLLVGKRAAHSLREVTR